MTDSEMVEMYRGYVHHRDSCVSGRGLEKVQVRNFDNLYRVIFESNGVTLAEIEQAASQYANTVAKKLFEAMFESDEERVVFGFRCVPSLPVWKQNGNNKLCGILEINGVETIDDKPMSILVLDEQVRLMWGFMHMPDRDPIFGPAIVDINADWSFVGHHIMGGEKVEGLPNWEDQCARHNLWMSLCV